MLPEDRQKQDQKMEDLRKKNQDEYKRVRAALQLASNDPNVQIVLRHVAKLAGFFRSSIVVNSTTGEIALNSLAFNEGRRSLYIDIRRMLSDDARRIVESKGDESHDS